MPRATKVPLTIENALNNPVKWTKQYQVGVPLIDNQHKRLFKLIEDLRLSFFHNKSDAIVGKVLNFLLDYCMEHFESEELLMQAVEYPDFGDHAQVHRNFTKQTLKWVAQMEDKTLNNSELLLTLVNWLADHVLTTDTKYAAHCKNVGVEMEDIVTLNDLSDFLERRGRRGALTQLTSVPLELVIGVLLLIPLGIFVWLAWWKADTTVEYACSAGGTFIIVLCDVVVMLYIRMFVAAQNHTTQVAHARRLAENLLAGEIANRVAVLKLDDIDELFPNQNNSSGADANSPTGSEDGSLVRTMKQIVRHMQLFIPYLPETVLALLRNEAEEEDDGDATSIYSARSQQQIEPQPLSVTVAPEAADPAMVLNRKGSMKKAKDGAKGGGGKRAVIAVEEANNNANNIIGGEMASPNMQLEDVANPNQPSEASKPLLNKGVKIAALPPTSSNSPIGARLGSKVLSSSNTKTLKDDHDLAAVNRRKSTAATLRAADMLEPWVQRKSISLMVADLDCFDKLNPGVSPAVLLEMHSNYISTLQEMVKPTKGVFHAIVGDRVVVSWNAANGVGDHAEEACSCALALRDKVTKDSEFVSRKLRVAIASGTAIVGNVGNKKQMAFCVIGAVPALAEALCQLNVHLQTEILISSTTWRDIKDMFLTKMVAKMDYVELVSGPTATATATGATATTTASGTSAGPGGAMRPVSAASGGGLGMILAFELKRVLTDDDDWVFASGESPNGRKEPYSGYHEALHNLLYGDASTWDKGVTLLEDYVAKHEEDRHAYDMLRACRSTDARTRALGWKFGWFPPFANVNNVVADAQQGSGIRRLQSGNVLTAGTGPM